MPMDLSVDLHTAADPHRYFHAQARILGARPGQTDFHDIPQGDGASMLKTVAGSGLNGLLSVHYRPNGDPYQAAGTTSHGRKIALHTHLSIGLSDSGLSADAIAANFILRLGALLEEANHVWSWTNPQTGNRYCGRTKFTGIAEFFAPHRAPAPGQIHDQLLGAAYEANTRDNLSLRMT